MSEHSPPASSENVRRTMLANRRRDTKPELEVRKRLLAAGLRYRVDFPVDLTDRRRRADIVFTRARLVVFIDGCFWHGCPDHYTEPRSNVEYWRPKIARNVARDTRTTEQLETAGWQVLRFWEHEDPDHVAERVLSTVRPEEERSGSMCQSSSIT